MNFFTQTTREEASSQSRIKDYSKFIATMVCLFLTQAALIFLKSMNWDEFLHFSQVYDLANGRLVWFFQTLQSRLFFWAPAVSPDIITQLQAARFVMLGFEIVAVMMVILLARQFVDREIALLTGLVYLAGGYTFAHGFSYRPDPMAAATLMTALYVLARRDLSVWNILLTGSLVGLAGMMTVKSIFYLPCFAGIAVFRLLESRSSQGMTLLRVAAVPVVAVIVFAVVLVVHMNGIQIHQTASASVVSKSQSFLNSGLFLRAQYTIAQALMAPLILIGIVLLPFLMPGRSRNENIVLASLLVPLVTLIFYRNTYPYFFVFLLAPVCVAIAPSIALLARRYSVLGILPIVLLSPIKFLFLEDYDVIDRQRALINEVHRLS
ncbi:hypothetical protein ACFQEX_20515 [Roseibium salinum]|uniref:hypothetical protein n=1 Tax=Roseibium salinum TaxID=1604349 RepID=UPI0036229F93